MEMATQRDDVVEVPYCSVCRRSSELKWRKHVFSKTHQHAAAELLVARVADVAKTRAQIAAGEREPQQPPTQSSYCIFCEITIESWGLWIQHYKSTAHRKKLDEFCKHHRCDASKELRPQLCLTNTDAQALTSSVATVESTSNNDLTPQPRISNAHAQAFLESAAARLEQVRAAPGERVHDAESLASEVVEEKVSWMGPHPNRFVRVRTVESSDGIQQNPLGRHEGKRVWGGGIVKVRKSEWIQWGIDLLVEAEDQKGLGDVKGDERDRSSSFQHRSTEAAFSFGLNTINRVEWGDGVANIHSAAVPPWMVSTEAEYKRCNQRANGASSQLQAARSAHESSSRTTEGVKPKSLEGSDIFARIQPKYDEETWLPNFGGVWQEGPRYKTQKEFKKMQVKHPRRNNREDGVGLEFRQLRTTVPSHLPQCRAKEEGVVSAPRELTTEPLPLAKLTRPSESASEAPQIKALSDSDAIAAKLNAKKTLLLAQKERLRAKLAAKKSVK